MKTTGQKRCSPVLKPRISNLDLVSDLSAISTSSRNILLTSLKFSSQHQWYQSVTWALSSTPTHRKKKQVCPMKTYAVPLPQKTPWSINNPFFLLLIAPSPHPAFPAFYKNLPKKNAVLNASPCGILPHRLASVRKRGYAMWERKSVLVWGTMHKRFWRFYRPRGLERRGEETLGVEQKSHPG